MSATVFERSPLYEDIMTILKKDGLPNRRKLSAELFIEDESIPIMQLMDRNVVSDFAMNTADDVRIRVAVYLGDYVHSIYPNKDRLELVITESVLNKLGSDVNSKYGLVETRYKVILDPSSPPPSKGDLHRVNKKDLNTSFLELDMALVDRDYYPLRTKTIPTMVYRGTSVKRLIESLMIGASNLVLIDGKPPVDGIDLSIPDRDEIISQIQFPMNTYIRNMPTYLQEVGGGVYKYGIGTYFRKYRDKRLWFVYPLFDFTRVTSTDRDIAVFYAAPSERLNGSERTFDYSGGVLSIVVTADRVSTTRADLNQLNSGMGFRMSDSKAMMKKPVEIIDGVAVANRARLNREMGIVGRADGLNLAPFVTDIGSNPYNEMSKVLERNTSSLTLVWENADPSLIYPGMPAKYMYYVDGEVKEVKGTIRALQHLSNANGTIITTTGHSSTCIVTIVTEPIDQEVV